MKIFYKNVVYLTGIVLFCFGSLISFGQAVGTIQIGSGTATNFNHPMNTNWGFNLTQQIVRKSEMTAGNAMVGDLTKIRFFYAGSIAPNANWCTWTVSIANSTRTSFASDSDWEPAASFTTVFSGVVSMVSNGWVEIPFTAPFNYTGEGLIVQVNENVIGYPGSSNFRSYTSLANTGMSARSDSSNPTTSSAGTRTGEIAQIQFEGIVNNCAIPTDLTSSSITTSSFNFAWTAAPGPLTQGYIVEYGPAGFIPGTGASIGGGTTTNTNYPVTGLASSTTYHAYVKTDCGNPSESAWVGPIVVYTNYCVPSTSNTNSTIASFTTTNAAVNISNTTGGSTGGYGDYSATHQIIATPGTVVNFNTTVTGGTLGYAMWIDWNSNLTFEPGEKVYGTTSFGNGPYNSTFTIPAGQAEGIYRLRMAVDWNNSTITNSCATITRGEYEDYSVIVYSIPTLPAPVQSATPATCVDGAELTFAGATLANVQYYWQTTATGTSTANNASSPFVAFENGTYYVRAFNSVYNVWSAASSVVVSNIPVIASPPAPIAAANPGCLTGTDIVITSPAPTGIQYFWQGTSPTSSSQANNASNAYVVTATGTYYVKAFEAATSCWSLVSSINMVIDTVIPNNPTVTNSPVNICLGTAEQLISATFTNPESKTLNAHQTGSSGCTDGILFNITTNAIPVTITAIDVMPFDNVAQTIEVYIKNGTYVGFEANQAAWTLQGTYTIPAGFVNTLVNIDVTDFDIPASTIQGIYLHYNAVYDGSGTAASHSNADMTISTGLGQCTAFTASPNTPRGFVGKVHYLKPTPVNAAWYDAATGGNVLSNSEEMNVIGTSVLPVANEIGTFTFYAESVIGGCASLERVAVVVNVDGVGAEFQPIGVSCNNGNDGSFNVSNIFCGTEPFLYSVDGGAFAAIPTNLTQGSHTVKIKDAMNIESSLYTINVSNALAPFDVTEIVTTNSQSTISWTAPGSEFQWNVVWGPIGFTPGDASQIGSATATDTFYIVTGLDGNTEYDIYVSADCGNGTVPGEWSAVSIWTDCDVYNLPFHETFDTDANTIVCWSVEGTSDGAWYVGVGANNNGPVTAPFAGDQNALFQGSSGSSARLISPTLIVTGQDSVAVMFAISQADWIGDQNTTTLAKRNGTSGAWTLVKTYTNNIPQWIADTVIVSTTGMDSLQLSFLAYDDWGYNNTIDEVIVEKCFIEPTADGSITVCRSQGSIDLTTATTPMFPGVWDGELLSSFISGSTFNFSNLVEGTYVIKHLSRTACAYDTAIVTVTITAPLSAGTAGTLNVCKNQPIGLFNGLSGNVDYGGTWYNAAGVALTGSTFTTGTLQGQQVYTYVVSNGICDADTAQVIVNIGSCNFVGVEDLDLFDNITISPNPSTGIFNIEGVKSPEFTYEVVDLNGRTIISETKITSSVTSVNLSEVETGIYMIRLKGEGSEKMIRLIKQ